MVTSRFWSERATELWSAHALFTATRRRRSLCSKGEYLIVVDDVVGYLDELATAITSGDVGDTHLAAGAERSGKGGRLAQVPRSALRRSALWRSTSMTKPARRQVTAVCG